MYVQKGDVMMVVVVVAAEGKEASQDMDEHHE